jgi:hypothetical protein
MDIVLQEYLNNQPCPEPVAIPIAGLNTQGIMYNKVLSAISLVEHTGNTVDTLMGEIVIPANTIQDGDVWEIDIAAGRKSTNNTSASVVSAGFTISPSNNIVRGVQIASGNSRIRITRSITFKGGKAYYFNNSGFFYHDYQSIQPNSETTFNTTIEQKLYYHLKNFAITDISMIQYVIFRKIN